MFSLSSSAGAFDINPEYLDHIHIHFEVPQDIELPSAAHDTFYSLYHPNYAEDASASVLDEDTGASRAAGFNVSLFAALLAPYTEVGKRVRDCTKDGMQDTAWDLWWSWVHEDHSFSARDELQSVILGCLESSIKTTLAMRARIAGTVAFFIMKGAQEVVKDEYDLAALADWLQVTNFYYIVQ